MNKRIGIISGAFNPIHSGQIAFALQAIKEAKLDKVYFMPERRPRSLKAIEHYGHRVAMIKQALKPHPKLKILELVETNFSVKQTLPKIEALFRGDQIVMLIGSDLTSDLPTWIDYDRLMKKTELTIGLTGATTVSDIEDILKDWDCVPKDINIVNCYQPKVSSSLIRKALRQRIHVEGLLRSVQRYSNKHWLYISFVVDRA